MKENYKDNVDLICVNFEKNGTRILKKGFLDKSYGIETAKLANIDKVDAILTYGSNIAHSISQITESNKIIQISLASSPTAAIGKYNFINWTKPETEAIRLGEEIKKLSEDLQQKMFSISQQAYEQVQKDEAQATSEGAASEEQQASSNDSSDDDVIDAEYTKE